MDESQPLLALQPAERIGERETLRSRSPLCGVISVMGHAEARILSLFLPVAR